MDKQKITLPVKKWGSINSKYLPESNDVGNDEFTSGSADFITNETGAIQKRPTDVLYNSTAFSSAPKDQFEAIFSSGVRHLLVLDGGSLKYSTGNGVFATATTGITASASMEYSMYQNRVYMDNGIDTPSVYDLTAVYGGVSYSVPFVTTMGPTAPSAAVTFAADSAGGSVPAGGHTYKVTFLYFGSEESNGNTASALHTVAASNFTVNITGIPVGGYGVTARKIYRDNNDGSYLLVGTVSNNTATTFTDTVSAGTTAIPTINNLPPVFSYITFNLSRNWVAGVPGAPSTLYWSLSGLPGIFRPNNFTLCNPKDPITGLASFQGATVVFNRRSFGKITGNTDDTFAYEEASGSVGCVDNRSIQVRTIDGVPVLVWLSDRGFYKFDGSSVTYISNLIEDLVNFNLQQVSFTTGSNNQSTQADYAAGTASPSIDIASNPGVITVLNPKKVYQAKADWEGGLSLINVATKDGSNQLKVPTLFSPTLASGSVSGAATIATGDLRLTTIPGFTGESTASAASDVPGSLGVTASISTFAQGFAAPTYGGTLTNISMQIVYEGSVSTVTLKVWSDALGSPGTLLYTGSGHSINHTQVVSEAVSIAIPAGTKFWIGFTSNLSTPATVIPDCTAAQQFTGAIEVFALNGSSWVPFRSVAGLPAVPQTMISSYVFAQDPVVATGSWASPVYDSFSSSAVAANVTNSATYVTSTSAILYVDASNDPTMSTGVTTVSFANPNGTNAVSTSNLRYWRLRYDVATTDDTRTPRINPPSLTFTTTGTWISQPIDCTTDVTSYDSLAVTQNVPAGTTATFTVATSSDNITYSSFGPIGSAAVARYIKVKVVLTTTTDNVSTPSVSLLKVSWAQTSTFSSSVINVGQVPTGWGVFQDAMVANGGTLTFYMRSASTAIGVASASYSVVSNGVFPPVGVVPLQYTQWKAVFTSAADSLPTISGVTVNWFVGSSSSPIRAASLFFNKTYYFSGAKFGSTTNNIVIVWDFENNWRVFNNVTISALGLFFNQPFYCDPARSNVYQWLIAPTGLGSTINMDVRTKAFDLGNVNVLKNVYSLRVTGLNTGTTIHAYYSVDRGTTWIEMLNSHGATGYTTATGGNKFSEYFMPDYSGSATVSGTTIIFRVTSMDAYPCTLMTLEPVLMSRKGNYLGRAV